MDVRISALLVGVVLIAAVPARGERVIFRRGFPSRNIFFRSGAFNSGFRNGFNNGFNNSIRAIGNNLFLIGGRVFERDVNGRPRPLFINRQTGRLVNATRPGTLNALGDFLGRTRNGIADPARRGLVDTFLRANGFLNPFNGGFDPNGGFNNGDPFTRRTGTQLGDGLHGNGGTPTGPVAPARPVVQITPTTPDGTVSPEACRNLDTAICGADANRNNRRAETQARKDSLFTTALSRLGIRPEVLNLSFQRASGRSPFFDRNFFGFFRELSGQLPSVQGIESTVKPSLVDAINASSFPPDVKQQMGQVVNGLQISAFPNFRSVDSVLGYLENCGVTGLSDAAFAVPGRNQVVICPGLLLRAKEAGNSNGLIARVIHVLAHEMGHHLGPGVRRDGRPATPFGGKNLFKPLADCVGQFLPDGALARVDEISSDTFAVETMVQFMNKNGLRGGQGLQFVSEALKLLCDSPRSPVHPTGTFRIKFLLGFNPGIRALLGCQGPIDANPGCTFQGAVSTGGK